MLLLLLLFGSSPDQFSFFLDFFFSILATSNIDVLNGFFVNIVKHEKEDDDKTTRDLKNVKFS